jgi:hypothetical protein
MPGGLTPTVHQLNIALQRAAPPLWRRMREKAYDPGAFDLAEPTVRLSGLTVRTAAKATRTRNSATGTPG